MATDDQLLLVRIEARLTQFEKAMKQASGTSERTARKIQRDFGGLEKRLNNFGAGAFKGLFTALAGFLGARAIILGFINNTIEQEKAVAQLNATLASTGGAVGISSAQLQRMAAALQSVTTFSDEAVISAQSQLTIFNKIGKDVFPRATEAILDLATKMGGDLTGATVKVGKALQDPVKGLTALSRVGVQFSDSQKKIITQLVKTGDLAKAQGIILKALEIRFGGAAEAARNTLGGALEALKNAWGELFEVQGPTAEALRKAIERLISAISSPAFKDAVNLIGVQLVNALTAAADAAPKLATAFLNLRQGAEDFRASFQRTVQEIEDLAITAGQFTGANKIGEMLGITDKDELRIDRAHEAVKQVTQDLEQLQAVQRKAMERSGDLIAGPAIGGGGPIDPAAIDSETDALKAEADAIDAANQAAKEAAAERKRAAAEVLRHKEAIVALIGDLERELSLVGASNVEKRISNELDRAGADATAEQRSEIERLVGAITAAEAAHQGLVDSMDAVRDAAGGALSAFNDALRNGEGLAGALKAALDRVLDTVIRIAEENAIAALFGASGGTGGGLFGSILGGVFGGAAPVSTAAVRTNRTGGAAPVRIVVESLPNPYFETRVRQVSTGVTAAGLSRYDRIAPASFSDKQRRGLVHG